MRYALTAAALAAMASTAQAGVLELTVRMICDSREAIQASLAERYQEHRFGGGVAQGDALFEIWSTADGRTWTITVTNTAGLTCITAAGHDWRERAMPVPENRS